MRLPSNLSALRTAWRAANGGVDRSCFRIENAATPKLYVYDLIGMLESDAADFVQAVHAIKAKAIDVHVNSPGGFVYDGVAMYEALKSHPATVNVRIDGLAASAASFLAMAGDSIEISAGGRMMIHDAQMVAMGSPAELREYADLAEGVSDDIAGIYAARAGGKPDAWRTAMRAETWYSASQAVEAKLADRVTSGKDKKDSGASNRSRLIKARAAVALGGVK